MATCISVEPDAEMQKFAHSAVAKNFRNCGRRPHKLFGREGVAPMRLTPTYQGAKKIDSVVV